MGESTKIQWAHHTFNPWWGCTKVSAACKNCYAEAFAKRTGNQVWGDDAPRRRLSDAHWRKPYKWNAKAEAAGERHRVFCASMADVFEDREDLAPLRLALYRTIEDTPSLDWLLLTKRPQHIMDMAPPWWIRDGFPPNVWVGTTIEDRAELKRRLPYLREVPAVVRFISYEPALEGIPWWEHIGDFDWLIVGGESGPKARPFHASWAADAIRDCGGSRPVYIKQLGRRPIMPNGYSVRLKDPKGGDPSEWSAHLRVREFPVVKRRAA